MNILYIGTILNVHDQKWAKSQSKSNTVYFIDANDVVDNEISDDLKNELIQNKVIKLRSIHIFSIFRFIQTIKDICYLRKIIRENKIDIVHILYAAPHAIWALFLPSKVMLTSRGSDVLITIPELKKGSFDKKILFLLFKKAFKRADCLTSTSDSQMLAIKQELINSKPIHLINTGVDVDSFNHLNPELALPEELKNKKLIFFPRFMKPIYNHLLELEALTLLGSSIIAQYTFVFIRGIKFDEEYLSSVKQGLAAIPNLNFHIYEYLPQEVIFSIIKASELIVSIPLSDGTSVSALEVMACKRPFILGTAEYDPKLFNNTSLRLTENEPKQLAQLMQLALQNYPQDLINEAYERVSKLGNRAVEMDKLQCLYKKLIS